MTESYCYMPLPNYEFIRLVTLYPASTKSHNVEVSIQATAYDEWCTTHKEFEALSYTWGEESHKPTIYVLPDRKQLHVTPNCYSALQRLRRTDTPRTVWIDAICINQADVDERNAQVAIMSLIYSRAQRVVIDIGDEADNSNEALFHLQTLREDCVYDFWRGKEVEEAIDKIFSRPWFKRVWVLQEVYHALEAVVRCGDEVTPWSAFRRFHIWLDGSAVREQEHFHVALPSKVPQALKVGNMRTALHSKPKDFLQLLVDGRECKASDHRDKVFALINLCGWSAMQAPHIGAADYKKSAFDVYCETACWLAEHTGLDFLSCAQNDRADQSLCFGPGELPSWVPDWTQTVRNEWMIGYADIYHPLNAGSATSSSTSTHQDSQGRLRLVVSGLEADTISRTMSDINSNSELDTSFSVAFDRKARIFLQESFAYRNSLETPIPLPEPPYWYPKTPETRIHPPDWLVHTLGLPIKNPIEYTDNNLIGPVMQLLASRKLALTSKGHIAFVPESAKPGQLIACFKGARVPFVLAKCGTDDIDVDNVRSRYKLIGESYVYGLMGGEAFQGFGADFNPHLIDFMLE